MATFDGMEDKEGVKTPTVTNEMKQIPNKLDDVTIEKHLTEYKEEVKQLTMSEKDYIEQLVLADSVKIHIHRDSGLIKIVGLSENVQSAEKLLKIHIQNTQRLKQEAKQARITAEYVQWNYQPVSGDEICLEDYDELTNLTLEKAFRDNKSEVKLLDPEGVESVVNFDDMMEYIQNVNKDKVKVIRQELKTGNPFKNKEVTSHDMSKSEEPKQDKDLSKGEFVYFKESVITKSNDLICSLKEHEVDVENGRIVVTGPPRFVSEAEGRIDRAYRHIERQRELDKQDKMQDVIVNWSYDLDAHNGSDTQDYDQNVNATLEHAFRNLQDEVELIDSERNVHLIIDFIDMIEYYKDNSQDYVRVYRKVKSKGQQNEDKNEQLEVSTPTESPPRGKTVGTVITIKQSTVLSLKELQVQELQGLHPAAEIKVFLEKSEISITGTNRVTSEAAARIRTYLRHTRRKRMLEQECLFSDYLVRWTYNTFDTATSTVVPRGFSEDLNSYIEDCYKHMADETSLFLPDSQSDLIVDFVDMVIYLETERNDCCALQRDVYRKSYSVQL